MKNKKTGGKRKMTFWDNIKDYFRGLAYCLASVFVLLVLGFIPRVNVLMAVRLHEFLFGGEDTERYDKLRRR